MLPKKNPSKDVHRLYSALLLSGLIISLGLVIMAFQWQTKKIKPDRTLPPAETGWLVIEAPVVVEQTTVIPKPAVRVPVIDLSQVSASEIPIQHDTFSLPSLENPVYTDVISALTPAPEPVTDTFLIVEKVPQPVGGYQDLYSFLAKAVRYPVQAKRNGTEGKVFVEFIIDKSGNVSNVRVVKGIGSGCDAEAARVIALTQWEPGKQRGVPVTVKMVLPIVFRLS